MASKAVAAKAFERPAAPLAVPAEGEGHAHDPGDKQSHADPVDLQRQGLGRAIGLDESPHQRETPTGPAARLSRKSNATTARR